MKIVEFLQHVEAELVGGRLKAMIDGVHHFVAEVIDGNPVLTAAGLAAKEELESRAPDVAKVIAAAPAAAAEVAAVIAAPGTGGVSLGEPVLAAVVKGAAEKAAVEGVDAVLDSISAKVAPKAKKA